MQAIFPVILAGVATSFIVWSGARALMRRPSMPPNPDLPPPWRLVWPCVSYLARWCGPMLSWPQRDRLARWGERAGLPVAVTPAHMLAGLIGVATLGAVAGAGILSMTGLHRGVFPVALLTGVLSALGLIVALVHRVRRRRRQIEREMPFALDLMTLCVEAGLSLHGALQQVRELGPSGGFSEELERALLDMRSGVTRTKALHALALRCDCQPVHSWVAAMTQAEQLGSNVGALLREHALQCRAHRMHRAEAAAMRAPVKMLFPLIGCIFPCTFIVLVFPIATQLWEAIP